MTLRRVTLVLIAVLVVGGGAVGLGHAHTTADSTENASDIEIDDAVLEGDGEQTVIVRLEDRPANVVAATATENQVASLQTHAETTQGPLEAFAAGNPHVEVDRQFWLTNAAVVTVDTDRVPIERLGAVDHVTAVHENAEVQLLDGSAGAAPTDHDAGTLPAPVAPANATATSGAEYTYGLELIGVPETWETFDSRGDGVRVAVLDSGIEAGHPDLELAEDGWKDIAGGSETPVDYDSNYHGTHVSGTVAGGGGQTQIGVAPDVELYHGAVITNDGGSVEDVIAGMEWAVESEADIVSMSIGIEGTHYSLIDPVRNAEESGVLVVAASGNDPPEKTHSPANVYESLAVGAVDETKTVAPFSSGEVITTDDWTESSWFTTNEPPDDWPEEYTVPDVVAPGVDVVSASGEDGYAEVSGTSMATPHVTGVAALMVSNADDDLEPSEIRAAIAATADDLDDEPTRQGSGLVNASAAVAAVAGDDPVGPVLEIDDFDDAFPDGEVGDDYGDVEITVAETAGVATDGLEVTLLVENDSSELVAETVDDRELENAAEPFDFTVGQIDEPGEYTATVIADADNATEVTHEVSFQVAEPETAATPELSGLEIADQGDDATVTEGDDATITAEVENVGDRDGAFTIELALTNGVAVSDTETTAELEAGARETVTFEDVTDGLEPGTYDVSVADDAGTDELTGTLTVDARSEPELAIGDFAAQFPDGDSGDDYGTVEITVEETADVETENLAVSLEIDGAGDSFTFDETVDAETLAGEAATFDFDVGTIAEADEYEVTVTAVADNAAAVNRTESFTVFAPAEAELSALEIAGQSDDATITDGDEEAIAVDVTNVGDRSDAFTVSLAIENGATIAEQESTASLDPGARETVTFEAVTGELPPGEYDVTVATADDDVTGTLTVDEAASEPGSPDAYANDEGVVDTDGLRDAVDDWRTGELETDQLRSVLDAWRSGDPVG